MGGLPWLVNDVCDGGRNHWTTESDCIIRKLLDCSLRIKLVALRLLLITVPPAFFLKTSTLLSRGH